MIYVVLLVAWFASNVFVALWFRARGQVSGRLLELHELIDEMEDEAADTVTTAIGERAERRLCVVHSQPDSAA